MTTAYRPSSLQEALGILRASQGRALPIAGGTDVMVAQQVSPRAPEAVLDLLRIPELRGIRLDGRVLDIGAACSFQELRQSDLVRRELPVLAEVAALIGGWQIQTRATLGGNIANASPAGDSLPLLLALDAELVLAGPDGPRRLPYGGMHLGYRRTALRTDELIVRVRLPLPRPGAVQRFKKVGTREAQAIAKVVVAFAAVRGADGALRDVRIAAGSVAPVPVRLRAAELACEGRAPSTALADAAASAARAEVSPIDDVRSTADYRRFALGTVVRRFVLECAR